MFVKFIALSCLVAAVSGADFPRGGFRPNIQLSASQNVPQAVAAPGSASEQAAKLAAQQAKLHYVEIGPSLKGDYKFGYDTGSGPAGQSFREETRLDDGSVRGAYGYVDANGKQRIVKYTAGKNGFVVEGDQEAPNQGSSAASAAPQQPEAARRPQPAALPQPQRQQPSFDDAPQNSFNRVQPQSAEDRQRAEQQHAEELRQHQLAQQAALAQQQKLAQQLQLQQQQFAAARAQQQQQPQQQQLSQQQFGFPSQALQQSAARHQFTDPQTGQFFSSSSDSNLNQLLTNQLRQLQSGNQFAGQFQPPPQAPVAPQQPQQQQFGAQAAPAFQSSAPQQFGGSSQPDFIFNQQRGARQAPQQLPATPQSALLALHQQQQQDAQLLANLRAQQTAAFQQQQQQQSRQAPAAAPQFQQPAEVQQPQIQRIAPQQQGLANSAAAPVTPQPENFGPPVIDIRTLNYSIGQQGRSN